MILHYNDVFMNMYLKRNYFTIKKHLDTRTFISNCFGFTYLFTVSNTNPEGANIGMLEEGVINTGSAVDGNG